MENDSVIITGSYQHSTAGALLIIDDESGEELWIPWSQIEAPDHRDVEVMDRGEFIEVEVSEWFARKEGFA